MTNTKNDTKNRTKTDTRGTGRLLVDPVACHGIGMCAHLAPALIHLDPWGYPIIPGETLDGADARAAIRAARGCPRRALRFTETPARQPARLPGLKITPT